MKSAINSNPLEFKGLRHKKLVQRPAAQIYKTPCHNDFVQEPLAQLPSSQNKERLPLTMEPSIDAPLAAIKSIMRCTYFSVNGLNRHKITDSVTNFFTPAKAGVQREKIDSRLRGNDKSRHTFFCVNESTEAEGFMHV